MTDAARRSDSSSPRDSPHFESGLLIFVFEYLSCPSSVERATLCLFWAR